MRFFSLFLLAAAVLLVVQVSAADPASPAVAAPAAPVKSAIFSGSSPVGRRITKKAKSAKAVKATKKKVTYAKPEYKPVKLSKKEKAALALKKAKALKKKPLTAADFQAPVFATAAPPKPAKPCAKKVLKKKAGPKFVVPTFKAPKAKKAAKAPCTLKKKAAPKPTASPFVAAELKPTPVKKSAAAKKAKTAGVKVEAISHTLPKLASTKDKFSDAGSKTTSYSLVEEEAGTASDKISAELHELLMQTEDLIAESD